MKKTPRPATNSERSTMACPMLWFIKYGLRLQPDRVAFPLRFGSYWHELMDLVWNGQAAEARLRVKTDQEHSALLTGRQFDPGDDGALEAAALHKVTMLAGPMLEGYITTYGSSAQRFFNTGPAEIVWTEHVLQPQRMELLRGGFRGDKPVGSYTGRVDKLVRVNGELWIVEHKTTTMDLRDWRAQHEYNPQGMTYGVLAERELGEPIRGTAYDIVRKGKPATAGDFQHNKDGTIARRMPKYASQEALAKAIELSTGGWKDWYESYLGVVPGHPKALPTLNDVYLQLYRRELVPFDRDGLRRRGYEMAEESSTLASWHGAVDDFIAEGSTSFGAGVPWQEWVIDAINGIGYQFPRNGSHCFRWHRPCEMMPLCRRPCVESCAGLTQREHTHAELETTQVGPADTTTGENE